MALTAAAVVVSSPGAWAANVKGSVVKSTKTSEWTTPSPDPSGIGFNVNTDRFLISDGEVEEMTIYRGVNIYDAETGGELVGTAVTVPWSHEPTGIAVNPNNGDIYVSDDDERSVFVVESLNDSSPGVIGEAKFAAHGVDPDLEGVGYDSKRNEILLANGERGAGFWRVKPGQDGAFGTGDDVVEPKILIEAHGGVDPEGIAYDAVRDTVIMVDGSANKIFEMNADGALLNTIDISGLGMDAPAGIEVAPASNGSGVRNYYIVDRGVDNNSDPNENDGMLYEVAAQLGDAGANQPPTANAGSDQVTTVGGTVTLNGSATDIETPSAELDYSWTKESGPAGVSFGTPNAATTTATFTEAGTFVLRLTVTDAGGLQHFADVTITAADAGSAVSVSRPVLASSDDAMEGSSTGGNFVDIGSKQNALGNRETGAGVQYPVTTGLRFGNIPVPKGGQVVSASIQFKVDVATTGPASFVIRGQAADNAPTFGGSGDITGRTTTGASVSWSPADWTVVNATGPDQRTPDLAAILQEIVDRPGWAANNAVALTIAGTGRRAAKAWDAGAQHAPVLTVTYTTGQTPPPAENKAPTVDAGADATVTLPAAANLDATVTDEDLESLTTTWSKLSGPGDVTFGDAAKVDTTATFGAAGEYVLRLTANDGALSASDDVKVTVKAAATTPPPAGGGGGGGGGGTPIPAPPTTPTTPTPPPAEVETDVTLQATHGAIVHGGTVRLDGTVTTDGKAAAGAAVELYVSRAGGDFELLDSGKAAGDGTFSFEDRPEVNSEYVARSGGSSSAAIGVTVRPRLGAKLRHSMVKAGTRTAIVGFVSPASDGHVLRLEKRFGSKWRTVRTISVAGGEQTAFRFMVRPKLSRAHWYRVVSPAQAGRALAVVGGKQLRLQAYNATVKRVNHRADLVVVRNTGRVAFSLEGWMLLERRSGHKAGLPDFTVHPGRVVRIHSGEGADNRRNLHLGTGEMWAPRGVAVLRDARLRLADRLRF